MQPGEQLAEGRFTLEQQITRSGMAEVWLARQKVAGGMSKSVVIKMIHPDLNAQQEARQRFFDEARFMSQIHHPHVVQFYDFGEEGDDILFQVMEYIEGFAIEQVISRARDVGHSVPIPIICRLIADACKGLGYIHDLKDNRGMSMELVHRDISPQNLLIAQSGTIKIIDFGIAKAREKSSRTRTGVIVGKLQYMSPEQLSSEDLDNRSDIYSMGLVLYELLTLQPRFRGSNLLEVFYEAQNEPPPMVVDLRPDCSPELVQTLHRALATDKEDRFRTAYHMQESLEAMLHRMGPPPGDRQVAAFLSDLFSGAEALSEHTTQIHAASILGASFGDDVSEATVAALESDLLHGGFGGGSDFGGLSSMGGGYGRDEVTSTQHQFSGLSNDYSGGFGDHTLAPSQSNVGQGYSHGADLGEHTLGGVPNHFAPGTVETTIPLPSYDDSVLDRNTHDPTRINAPMPDIPVPPQPVSSIPYTKPVTPPPPSTSDHEESVMIDEALRAEAGNDIQVISNPSQTRSEARASRPAAPPPKQQQAPRPAKKGFGLSSQAIIMIALGLGAFVLGILMVVLLYQR